MTGLVQGGQTSHIAIDSTEVEPSNDTWAEWKALTATLAAPNDADFLLSTDESCEPAEWVAIEWYGECDVDSFVTDVLAVHDAVKRPLIITSFGCIDSEAETIRDNALTQQRILDFMKQALPWLESSDVIAGYAWYDFDISSPEGTFSSMFYDNGVMTAIGQYYTSVSAAMPRGDLSIQPDRFN